MAAKVSNDRILLWNLDSLALLHTISTKDPQFELPAVKNCTYTFQLTPNGRHLVMTRDNAKVYSDAKDVTSKTSVVFVDVETGKLHCSYSYCYF